MHVLIKTVLNINTKYGNKKEDKLKQVFSFLFSFLFVGGQQETKAFAN